MVLSMRFERMTCSLGGSRSIQLSYESLPKDFFRAALRCLQTVLFRLLYILSYNIAVICHKVKLFT